MKNKVLILFLGLFFFIGCGGNGKTSTTSLDIGNGTYVDSAVDGVKYVCGSQTGLTGDTGVTGGFKYEKGKTCTFSINGINLSKVDGDKLTGDEIEIQVGDTDVAIFLQSLDIDGDPDNNGITVSSKVIEVLAKNNKTALPKTEEEVKEIVALLYNANIGYTGKVKTRKQAQMHMAGFSLTMSATKTSVLEGAEVHFSADVEGTTEGLTYEWVGYGVTTPEFTKNDFAAGEHVVVVNVTKGNITLSASQTIVVTPSNEFIVSIKFDKTKYTTDDTVVLEANITGNAGSSQTYSWKDGDTSLTGATKTISQKFTAGEHNVTVEVTGRGITKSANFIFNVADMADFNVTSLTITQKKKIMWVNAPVGKKDKNNKIVCLAIHGDELNATRGYDDSFDRARTFCNLMDFAGFTNWRTPTTDELSEYIKKTNEAGIVTKYDHPCYQLLAIDNVNEPMDGASYKAVATRFFPTKYNIPIGTIRTDHTYTKSDHDYDKYPVGLRCVRNTDGSGGDDIPGANILVTVTGAKAEYIVGKDVNLTATVTGATNVSSYSWKEGDTVLSTTNKLSEKGFAEGSHTVTLKVKADDFNKTTSVTFNIVKAPDLSNFELLSLTASKDEVIIQKNEKLMWVNEHDKSKEKCAKIHGNTVAEPNKFATELNIAKNFCSSIDGFADKSGWRTPTKSELKMFIESTIAANVLPAYDAHCARLLALKDSTASTDSNNSYVTVTTRYGAPAGIISAPGTLITNIGLRCVRNNN